MGTTWRNRGNEVWVRNRLAIAAELITVSIIRAFELVGSPTDFVLFPLSWLSLWLRQTGWREVGLRRPTSWLRLLGLGALIGVVYQLAEFWLIDPLMVRLARQAMERCLQHVRIGSHLPWHVLVKL